MLFFLFFIRIIDIIVSVQCVIVLGLITHLLASDKTKKLQPVCAVGVCGIYRITHAILIDCYQTPTTRIWWFLLNIKQYGVNDNAGKDRPNYRFYEWSR